VLTQYKAQTLIGHITSGWNFLPRHLGEFVDVWPAQQRLHAGWYGGTADAVRQNLDLILAQGTRYTLVLASDHIYKMDFRPLLEQHALSRANVTIACLPVAIEQASSFGVLGVDPAGTVRSFREKPAPSMLDAAGGMVLASMGIYIFDTDYLALQLERDARAADSTHDFGSDILPVAVREDRVGAFVFAGPGGSPGYWRDVGTLEAYWQAHMELLADEPAMDLYDPDWPIWTMPEQLPPARLSSDGGHRAFVADSMLSGGVVIRGAVITNSVIGGNARVERDTLLGTRASCCPARASVPTVLCSARSSTPTR
jgi:glucose-1-phosphate adenylyltransferase